MRRLAPLILGLLIGTAIAGRAYLHLSTPYAPGMNGGYYLVQARAVMEHGALGIPDLPLTFHLHALLAWLLMKLSNLSQADAILWAVRFSDSVIPPLTALPVFALLRRWAERSGRSEVIPLIAAGLSILAFPLFTMVGDFQKNSIGLLWLACLLNSVHAMLDRPDRRTGGLFILSLLLLGLTHIGVLGTAIITTGAILLVYAVLNYDTLRQGRLPWIVAGLLVLAGAASLVLVRYDPARIHKLATAIKNLDGSTREAGDQAPGPRRDGAGNFRPDAGPGGPGLPGDPRGNASPWMRHASTAAFIGPSLFALFFCWRRRRELSSADLAAIIGTSAALIAITGPWVDMDKVQRLNLIAIVPAAVVSGFALLSIPPAWIRNSLGILALGWLAGSAAPLIARGGRPILSPEAMSELRSLSDKGLFNPDKTLIVTRHGAEWWTAWFLRTRIAQPRAVQVSDWDKYDQVLYLAFTGGIQEPNFAGGPGRPNGPNPNLRGKPGPLNRPDPPNPDEANRLRNRRGPGGMGGPNIPRDAKVLHQSRILTLAQVDEPPTEVRDRADENKR